MQRALAAGLLALLVPACGKDKGSGAGDPPPPVRAVDAAPPPVVERSVGVLGAGTAAPDFTAPAHDGSTITISALRGRPVVLYFYPKDETPG
jgi:hypothetical protein